MKVLYDYHPNPKTSEVTISPLFDMDELGQFGVNNLRNMNPVYTIKTLNTATAYIVFDFGEVRRFNSFFINGFNFAQFKVYRSNTETVDEATAITVSGLTKDEIVDENYMHYFLEMPDFNNRYLVFCIPTQTPLFSESVFKIGNILIGNSVEIWNPPEGYSIEYVYNYANMNYDSGYYEEKKIGRTRRKFTGSFDKITQTEYNKLRLTNDPIVLYHDWDDDPTKAYLVKPSKRFQKSWNTGQLMTHSFEFIEFI